MNELQAPGRVAVSRRERDVSTVMRGVLDGERTQVEAARLLEKSARQVRRLQRRMEAGEGHGGAVPDVNVFEARCQGSRHDPSAE